VTKKSEFCGVDKRFVDKRGVVLAAKMSNKTCNGYVEPTRRHMAGRIETWQNPFFWGTAINFILPSVLTFECETEYSKYLKETDETFFNFLNNSKPNQDKTNILNLAEHKQIFAKG
jgi:hypothetical protein